jgi:hypothetical protein
MSPAAAACPDELIVTVSGLSVAGSACTETGAAICGGGELTTGV